MICVPFPADVTPPEWSACNTRGPWVRNSLRAKASELRIAEGRARKAYSKDYMRVPCEYIADAYAEAAAVIEARLAALEQVKESTS